jgi:hypothetical protein
VEQTITSKRIPRAMDVFRFVLGIVLGHGAHAVRPADGRTQELYTKMAA